MKTIKKSLALLLAVLGIIGIFAGCESEPEEIYLTTSNLSEYLDVKLELVEYTLVDDVVPNAEYLVTTTGKSNMNYKDVEITYNLVCDTKGWGGVP